MIPQAREPGQAGRPVLIVDDSAYARGHLRRFLVARGFRTVLEAADGDEALRVFFAHRPIVVLLDQVMRGREGLETARLMLAQDPTASIIMLTAVTDWVLRDAARGVGIERVVQKMDFDALEAALCELGHA